jgi:hypothetical protein
MSAWSYYAQADIQQFRHILDQSRLGRDIFYLAGPAQPHSGWASPVWAGCLYLPRLGRCFLPGWAGISSPGWAGASLPLGRYSATLTYLGQALQAASSLGQAGIPVPPGRARPALPRSPLAGRSLAGIAPWSELHRPDRCPADISIDQIVPGRHSFIEHSLASSL